MGSTSELSLFLEKYFTQESVSDFLRHVSTMGDGVDRLRKLEQYVKRLEEERNKIYFYKRDLPNCMSLLNNVIQVVKEEAVPCRSSNAHPVLEELMPIRSKLDEDRVIKREKDNSDKMNWMSSAQLWSNNSNNNANNKKNKSVDVIEKAKELDLSASQNPFPRGKYWNGGGAFMPFSHFPAARKEEKAVVPLSDDSQSGFRASSSLSSKVESNSLPPKKKRRNWTQDLHRRFLNALQQLGGSRMATPTQIRNLMKSDKLTSDEVKSHLQKYRLHTQGHSESVATSTNQRTVMLGGNSSNFDDNAEKERGK
ncbi:myb family transcription factor EFM-like [Tasmannia lanceolata]|uniref:myb family transcription factor EFM-like n=1 Tax=Tasmannia lanceolata TaxID=3420 RepID=UPI0040635266